MYAENCKNKDDKTVEIQSGSSGGNIRSEPFTKTNPKGKVLYINIIIVFFSTFFLIIFLNILCTSENFWKKMISHLLTITHYTNIQW